MLSAHHNRNNSEVQPLRNSREDIVASSVLSTAATHNNLSHHNTTATTSPVHHNRSDTGGDINIMGDDTQRILIKIVIDLVLLCCGKFKKKFFSFFF